MRRYVSRTNTIALSGMLTLLLVFAWNLPCFALDPQKAITQYGHNVWTSQQGLPGEATYEIGQTQDGYLWLRTSNGLIRFDGGRFVPIEPVVRQEPLKETIRAICRGADGNLLLRSATHTLRYKDGNFSDYLPPAPLPIGTARILLETREHNVWIGGDNALYRVGENGFTTLQNGTGWLFAFLQDRQGNVWIGGTYGLYQYRNNKLVHYSARYGMTESVTALAEDRQGTIWVGMRNGFYRLHNGKPVQDSLTSRFANQHISALLPDRHGNLWVGTDTTGLYRLANGRWSVITAQEGLTDNSILSLYEDREGSLWVGTKSGLERFRDTSLTTFTTREGLAHNDTSSVVEGKDGSLFVFSQGGGLTRLKQGAVNIYTTKDGLGSHYGNGLYAGKDGSIWIGTTAGLSQFKDGKIATYTDNGRLTRVSISAIHEDEESLLVASSDCQVRRFKGGKFYPYTIQGKGTPFSQPSPSELYVFTFYRDGDGTLWFGTGSKDADSLYKASPGKPPVRVGHEVIPSGVATIYNDGQGSLWLGGKFPGLRQYRLRDNMVFSYVTHHGLFDEEITSILGDPQGNLWMSTSRGIFSVPRKDLEDIAEQRSKTIHPTAYGIADGMKTTEAAIPEHQPAGCQTRDGKLWFATQKGLVMADPNHLLRNNRIPSVILEEILVDGETHRADVALELPPGTKKVEFHYTALSLLIPERVRFRYKLEGYDHEWAEVGNRRVAYYTGLPPGPYRFQVTACNNDGVWNTSGATGTFSLLPHFYETREFAGLCVFGVVLGGMGLHRLRVRHLHLREQELTRLVGEKTRSLQAEIGVRQQAETALQQAHDQLEHRVAERTEELYQANTHLQAEIAERTRAEEALRESEEAERRFGERLTALQEVVNTLSRAETFEDLCRQAVELGRSRLQFDRLGIWFTAEDDPGIVQGAFGVDEEGRLRDERQVRFPVHNTTMERILAYKIPLWRENDISLVDHHAERVGRGASATAALWDGERAIGFISTDNLLERRPLTEQDCKLLTLYATALGTLCTRKRTAEALEENRANAVWFSQQLVRLQDVTNQLSKAASFDELCRQAVELGRHRLGVDRLGIWFVIEDGLAITGSFGTDENGHVRDERGQRHLIERSDFVWSALSNEKPVVHFTDSPLSNEQALPIGRGENVVAALWNGDRVIGFLSADNLLTQQPITPQQVEIIRLYATSLGYLFTHKRAEEALQESETRYRSVITAMAEGVTLHDPTGAVIACNESACRILGMTHEEMMAGTTARGRLRTIYEDGSPFPSDLYPPIVTLRTGQPQSNVIMGVYKFDGALVWVSINSQPLMRPGESGPFAVVVSFTDITDIKKAEEALRESEERFRTLAENAPDSIMRLDAELRYIYLNPRVERYVGLPAATLLGKTSEEIGLMQEEAGRNWHTSLRQVFQTGQPTILEFDYPTTRGVRSFEARFVPEVASDGSTTSVLGISRDITERKQAEEAIKRALIEKEVLLKEVHHRVKNNLQILSSLLKIQAEFIRDPYDLTLFQESQSRIRSMAVVHEQLYQSGDLAHIDFGAYVRHLITYLFRSFGADVNRVRLQVDIEDILLGVDTAIPCGLVVNELISNALKYAFPEGREGNIRVGLSVEGNQYQLVVADDGVGLPPEIDLHAPASVGLELVTTLVRQLKGNMEVARGGGTTFRIRFAAG